MRFDRFPVCRISSSGAKRSESPPRCANLPALVPDLTLSTLIPAFIVQLLAIPRFQAVFYAHSQLQRSPIRHHPTAYLDHRRYL